MLDAIIVGPNAELSQQIQRLCTQCGDVVVYRTLKSYDNRYEVVRMLNTLNPQIVFLEARPSAQVLQTARGISAANSQVAIVAYGDDFDQEQLSSLREAGVHTVLTPRLDVEKFRHALISTIETLKGAAIAKVLAFLPAKAGSGASTVALNLAGALVRHHKKNVLLIDADRNSGVQALLTGAKPKKSLFAALQKARDLDEKSWAALTTRVHGLDLLAAPQGASARRFSSWDYTRLLGLVRTRYDSVIVDLPETVDEATEAIGGGADHVFVVCTPELASLSLARRRISELLAGGIRGEQLVIALNRFTNRGLKPQDVERTIGREVKVTIPNDYAGICKASLEARPLEGRSNIAQAFADLAAMVAGNRGRNGPSLNGRLSRALKWPMNL